MTRYQLHVHTWINCVRCDLHHQRQNVCLCRGNLPCDVLFIGEAPGDSEDVFGKPFKGPAGQLLDEIILTALPASTRYALTNLIGCIPYELDRPQKAGQPPDYAIKQCRPRVVELIQIAKPLLIVAVGEIALANIAQGHRHSITIPAGVSFTHIIHPAAILRANEAQKGLAIQRAIISLRNNYNNAVSRRQYNSDPIPVSDQSGRSTEDESIPF